MAQLHSPPMWRRVSKMIFNRRAVGNSISATILTGAVIALSLAVFTWSQGRSEDYSKDFSETVDRETAKLKEKLVFEYVSSSNSSNDMVVYLINCGAIDDVEIKSVFVTNDTWFQHFSTPTLKFLGGPTIPDQNLDVEEEGYFTLSLSSNLASGYYNIRVVTARGAAFDEKIVV